MTVEKAVRLAKQLKEHDFSDEVVTMWLNEVEGKVQTDVLMLAPSEIVTYDYERDAACELLVAPPHDKIYVEYLTARIDYANEDYDHYQNTMAMFNQFWAEFVAWFMNNHHPATGFRT